MNERKLIKETVYKAGYIVRRELVKAFPDADPFEMDSAFNFQGVYIGDKKTAYYLCSKRGIIPYPRDPTDSICSIGFNAAERKWYGWSHRAIYGFKVGSRIRKGYCGYSEERGEWTAKTLDDAKQMAIDFAEDVS